MQKDIKKIEEQIYELRKTVRYDIRDLTVEQIVGKYTQSLDENFEEESKQSVYGVIYIPDYQRHFVWEETRQSKLIESLILGLPIPFIFVAENKQGNWEVVDGSQRIRTLHNYMNNKLKLIELEKLNLLNDTKFNDLDIARQSKIKDTALRIIVLSEETTDEVKKDMFERINRGSDLLQPMEKRKGIYLGEFNTFIYEYAKNKLLQDLIPLSSSLEKRQEREELLLRFFGLMDAYLQGTEITGVAKYLDDYLSKQNEKYKDLSMFLNYKSSYENTINEVLYITDNFFPYGFRHNQYPHTKRSVFEAISIGIAVFLKKQNRSYQDIKFNKEIIKEGLTSSDFKQVTQGNQLHKKKKLKGRIDFIVNLLNDATLE